MEFYKIEHPTTEQIFNAIIANEYVPIEKMQSKAKQIKVLLLNHFNTNEILVTFDGVTNTGGYPIFLSPNCCLNEICSDLNSDWYELSEEEQDNEIELLSCYMQTYDNVFNL
jgi:hypothetical protein